MQTGPGNRIQRPEWLIQEKRWTVLEERPRKTGSLTHSAGKLAGKIGFKVRKPEGPQLAPCPLNRRRSMKAGNPEGQCNIVPQPEPGKQKVFLLHQGKGAGASGQVSPVQDHAALIGLEQACGNPQQCGLSCPAWSKQAQLLAGSQAQGHLTDHGKLPKAMADPGELEQAHLSFPCAAEIRW